MSSALKVLVTGATGFIGSALVKALDASEEFEAVAASREPELTSRRLEKRQHDLLDSQKIPYLGDIDTIIHTAARVHVMAAGESDDIDAFRAANLQGTITLAHAAVKAGVRRLIYVSSVKVNGERTEPGKPFTAFDTPCPKDPYGISKFEAEQALQRIAASTGLELVIVRPPLVYGPGVKANFEGMMKWLHKGIPLPLGAIDNRRSLVFIDNLVDLLMCCIRHPGAAGGVFLVSDGEDLSTTELLQRVTSHLGIPNRLLPIPIKLVNTCAGIFGRIDLAQRLCDSLQVSIAHTEEILKWKPPFSVEHGLIKTADAYLRKRI